MSFRCPRLLASTSFFFALSFGSLVARADDAPAGEPEPPAVEAPPPAVAAAQPAPATSEMAAPGRTKAGPERKGVTFEAGIGASLTSLGDAAGAGVSGSRFGLAPLNLALGGFLTRDVALSFRITGTSVFHDSLGGGTRQMVLGFYGPSLQVFLSDDVFVSGGIGLGLLADNPLLRGRSDSPSPKPLVGLAGNARIGWNLFTTKDVALLTYAEVTPARVEDVNALGFALGLGFQAY